MDDAPDLIRARNIDPNLQRGVALIRANRGVDRMRGLLLGLAMIVAAGSAWAEDAPADPEKFLPISLECPAENSPMFSSSRRAT
jgi:hypothetical protein